MLSLWTRVLEWKYLERPAMFLRSTWLMWFPVKFLPVPHFRFESMIVMISLKNAKKGSGMQLIHLLGFLHTLNAFLSLSSIAFRSVLARPTPLLAPIFSSLLIQSSFTDVFALSSRTTIAFRQSGFFNTRNSSMVTAKIFSCISNPLLRNVWIRSSSI